MMKGFGLQQPKISFCLVVVHTCTILSRDNSHEATVTVLSKFVDEICWIDEEMPKALKPCPFWLCLVCRHIFAIQRPNPNAPPLNSWFLTNPASISSSHPDWKQRGNFSRKKPRSFLARKLLWLKHSVTQWVRYSWNDNVFHILEPYSKQICATGMLVVLRVGCLGYSPGKQARLWYCPQGILLLRDLLGSIMFWVISLLWLGIFQTRQMSYCHKISALFGCKMLWCGWVLTDFSMQLRFQEEPESVW